MGLASGSRARGRLLARDRVRIRIRVSVRVAGRVSWVGVWTRGRVSVGSVYGYGSVQSKARS